MRGIRESQNRNGFTLIELLVVIGIIALLAAILFPVFASARKSALHANAASNAHQLSLACLQYSGDSDDMFAPYFSGFDVTTGLYHAPQQYWPQLVSTYIAPVKGRGLHGQALADDLPSVFFDPLEPFKSQLGHQNPIGIISSWGVSDNIVDWIAPEGVKPSKQPLSQTAVANPAGCVYLVQTYDWMFGEGFPGNALSLSYFDYGNTGASISVDAPYGTTRRKDSQQTPADPAGSNLVVFADGHVAATRVGALTKDGTLWSASGTNLWR